MTISGDLGYEPSCEDIAAFLDGGGSGELGAVIAAVATAAVSVAAMVAREPLQAARGTDGETRKSAVVRACEMFEARLREASVRALVCEDRDAPTPLDADGRFLVAIEPLGGSAQIEANAPPGSIFSILDAPERGAAEASDFMVPGNRQRAAGMIVYGPHVSLIFTVGAGSHIAVLDAESRTFRMTRTHIDTPEGRAEFAINAANARHWPSPVRAYIDDCVMGETGPRGKDFGMLWSGSLAADAYRVLLRGGVYLEPDDARPGHADGRLRLLYQANPIALLVEQAGGLATDGVNRILDIPPRNLHARTPMLFGSTDKIERIRDYYVDGYRSASRAPLFGRRGLLRN